MSTFESEHSQSSESHYDYLCFVLKLFGRYFSNVVGIVGDNRNVNRALADKAEVGFIGCSSHIFNLAVKDIMCSGDSTNCVEKVRLLMKYLRRPVIAEKLREKSHLCAKYDCPTRWSSTASMLERFIQLSNNVFHDWDDDDIPLLNNRDIRTVTKIYEQYSQLDLITKTLQSDTTTCREVRILFDAVIQEYLISRSRLASNAKIVHNPQFESALVKIQDSSIDTLTSQEVQAVEVLKISDEEQEGNDIDDSSLSFVQRALKRRKLSINSSRKKYLGTRFLLPHSNMCERFFSKAGYTMTDRRKLILPSNFEQQLFLCTNASYWGLMM